ncbi:hypothetical protein LEP1GSC111_1423 [Leptospira interrogans str. UT126]|nr:hypothetical protein LEP1GSC111_1423 [Leptospira interrogans str. UT126]
MLKKNNQVRVKPKKQERSRVSSWPFLFQERSFKTFDQQTKRFYDQSKKSQALTSGFFAS